MSVAYGEAGGVEPPPPPAARTAESSCVETVVNMVFSELPSCVRATTAATETRAAMSPYSMAVAPDLSLSKFRNLEIITVTPYTLATTEETL